MCCVTVEWWGHPRSWPVELTCDFVSDNDSHLEQSYERWHTSTCWRSNHYHIGNIIPTTASCGTKEQKIRTFRLALLFIASVQRFSCFVSLSIHQRDSATVWEDGTIRFAFFNPFLEKESPRCSVCDAAEVVPCPCCSLEPEDMDSRAGYFYSFNRMTNCKCCKTSGQVSCRACFHCDPWDIASVRRKMKGKRY